jgi:hypothetical protein
MFVTRDHQILLMAVAAFVLSGCGSKPAPPTDLVPVEGQLLLDGKPLTGAAITLLPQDAAGKASAGTSDTSGNFRLSALSGDFGAKPGKYKVLVIGRPTGGYAPPPGPDEVPLSAIVPARYGLPEATPLHIEVPPPGPLVLRLTSR